MTAIDTTVNAFVVAIDARIDYEVTKNVENTSIVKTLRDLRKSVDHVKIAEIMLACNVDADFINRAERVSARFNVYSAEKVVNVARAQAAAASLNHYTRAIFLTALALENVDLQLTHKDAVVACSRDAKHSDAKRAKHVVRYDKCVAASTCATQSSSSINALQMFSVFKESRDAANNVCYSINRDAVAAIALAKHLNVAL